ncbi:MAG TPA: efflux RND transporter periplasmic adaptor subunit [Myxococcaceae bacterium]|nr:efflux RND transporter periplasmic adaptor subunit [Myxococcaceae bacterium]
MKLSRIAIPVGVLGAAAVVFLAVRPRPQPVDLGEVHRGPLRVTVDEDGKVRVQERHVVSSPLAGTLMRPELKAGDAVETGAVLARLVPVAPPLLDARTRGQVEARVKAATDAVRQADAALARARSSLELSEREAARAQNLAKAGSIAQEALDRAQFDRATRAREVDVAARAVDVARHDLEVARAALLQTRGGTPSGDEAWTVTAPVRGVVLRVLQESEGVVQPGTPLFELGDMDALEVVADLLTTDAVAVRPGAEVLIERWGGDHPLHARVRRVEPSAFTKVSALGVEEQRVNVIADLTDEPAQRSGLGDGYRVQVRVVTVDVADALLAPVAAAFRQGQGWAVFVVEDGRARLRPVKLGRRNDSDAEVLSGLTAGEKVVLYPGETLRDGTRVEMR